MKSFRLAWAAVGLLTAGCARTLQYEVVPPTVTSPFRDTHEFGVPKHALNPDGGTRYAAATGHLADFPELRWRDGAAVTVVVASEGYPADARVGTDGLERIFQSQLAGRPGGKLGLKASWKP